MLWAYVVLKDQFNLFSRIYLSLLRFHFSIQQVLSEEEISFTRRWRDFH